MTAKIGLEDVRFHAPHGFYEEEHRMGNEFSIDVEVEASITGAAENDDLGGTVNYATIYYLLQAEMKKPTQLLEALAYRMGNRIMNQFDTVSSVKLRLRKLNPPLGGKVGAAVVEIQVDSRSGSSGSFGGGLQQQHTYEDEPMGGGGAFGGGGMGGMGGGMGGGGMDGLTIKRPPPPAPIPVFDDDAFDDEDDGGFYDDEEGFDDEGHFDEEGFDEEGFDDGDFEDFSEEDMLDYEDEDDFDPSDFEDLMKKLNDPDFDIG
ncbi:dihydroneopterin aldolase [Neolewinella agarilytica]|uniref:7,8-dihydroneopterin aldolase n=1 Tax=Neolewinella agarilytica TaxID=478744 RepID=A0A1H9ADD0_9BACT|nr:dihydroneopterin aldolase [Neolewinella agarilytica]SEP74670.1 dihydroneopterin aldolase [Neolewinella agarilytica]